MITICNGLIRSGSTWSFNVCRLISHTVANAAGRKSKSTYLEDAELDQFLSTEAITNPEPTVVKAHDLGPVALEWLRTGRALAICTIRDPRDCVASDLQFMNQGMDFSAQRILANLNTLVASRSFGRTLIVRYEEMMANRPWQIIRIATHMGAILPPELIKAIDDATNVDASLKVCQDLKNRPAEGLVKLHDHLIDRITQLHDNHINNARTGRWKDELSPQDAQKLTQIFQRWLIRLGYETERSLLDLKQAYAPLIFPKTQA